jgi:adenine-specific DNA-methyltransferase
MSAGALQIFPVASPLIHQPRQHAAVRTREYLFSQLIPYLGNKRKLLHLIADAIRLTGCRGGTFVDLFSGSSVVSRLAKKLGFRVLANGWEPYAYEIARGPGAQSARPPFSALGGAERVFARLNALPPVPGYIATHFCPQDDEHPDPLRERMFFTRVNGQRIDAIREQVARWEATGQLDADERAYILASLMYAVSYASNTSGVFKGFHHGWGGKTGTALYRIRGRLKLSPPVLFDNGLHNLASCADGQELAQQLDSVLGSRPDILYVDPPYNQHPYGSNYHLLTTVALWDKPCLSPSIQVDGRVRDKSAIRKDWRSRRRSAYNAAGEALLAFQRLVESADARWVLVSYSTDGNIPVRELLSKMAARGRLHVVTQKYKRYRVSTPRMSKKSHNVEFVAVLDTAAPPLLDREDRVDRMVADIHEEESRAVQCVPDRTELTAGS